MRILYIHQYFSTPDGSTGTRSYEFGRRLVQDGHDVTILCGQSPLCQAPDKVEGMRVLRIPVTASNRDSFPKRAWRFLCFCLRSLGPVLTRDYDLVLATSTPLTVGVPALAARHLRGKKMVFEVRDLWPELPHAMGIIRNRFALVLLEAFERLCYRSAHACIGLSPGIVEGIRRVRPIGPVCLIPNACDLELFGKGGANTLPPENFLFGPGDFVALFCGAHGMANGLDAVLDAATVLKQQDRKDIHLVFIGDGQRKGELVQRAKAEGLDNCHFADPVSKHDIARWLAHADAGLMILADVPAFQYGTSPNKFFDYIASGLPVLCNYPGWISDMLTEYKCGLSTSPGNAQAFADALIQMVDNPKDQAMMASNARRLAETDFDRETLYIQLRSLLKSVYAHA